MASPVPILLGFVCQYSVLPVLAVVISKLMALPPAFATGLILLGCCPGACSWELGCGHGWGCGGLQGALAAGGTYRLMRCTQGPAGAPPTARSAIQLHRSPNVAAAPGGQASNVATFVAHGDVALSVLMTAASTVAATVMTPALTSMLAGAYIPVDGWVSWRLGAFEEYLDAWSVRFAMCGVMNRPSSPLPPCPLPPCPALPYPPPPGALQVHGAAGAAAHGAGPGCQRVLQEAGGGPAGAPGICVQACKRGTAPRRLPASRCPAPHQPRSCAPTCPPARWTSSGPPCPWSPSR